MDSNMHLRNTLDTMKKFNPDGLQQIFKRHGIDPSAGLYVLIREFRRDGSNTFKTHLWRDGEGVDYDEILGDVGWALGVKDPNEGTIERKERAVVDLVLSKLKPEERDGYEKLRDGIREARDDATAARILFKAAAAAGLLIAREQVVIFLIKQGMKRYAARAFGSWNPIAAAAMVLWTVNDIAGPAYRKTIPTIIDVAFADYEQGEI